MSSLTSSFPRCRCRATLRSPPPARASASCTSASSSSAVIASRFARKLTEFVSMRVCQRSTRRIAPRCGLKRTCHGGGPSGRLAGDPSRCEPYCRRANPMDAIFLPGLMVSSGSAAVSYNRPWPWQGFTGAWRTDVFESIAEEPMIRDFVRQVAKKYGREYWLAEGREGVFADELWRELAEGGFLGMMIPPEYGGGGLGLQQMAVLIEEMGHQGIPLLLVVVGNVMDAALIARYGSEEMKDRYLPPLAPGEIRLCFALTEPSAGSNSFRTATSARL